MHLPCVYLCLEPLRGHHREMTTGKGFADVVFIPYKEGDPFMIVELKCKGSAASALSQIKEKRYFGSLSYYQDRLLFMGINYDEKSTTHTRRIERF